MKPIQNILDSLKKDTFTKIRRLPEAMFSDEKGIYKATNIYVPATITRVEHSCVVDGVVVYNDTVSISKFY